MRSRIQSKHLFRNLRRVRTKKFLNLCDLTIQKREKKMIQKIFLLCAVVSLVQSQVSIYRNS